MSNSDVRPRLNRYTRAERTYHWLAALSFVFAALSGLAMFHPALYWFNVFSGGGTWTRILHPFIGLFMLLVFLLLATDLWSENRMRPADWQWLRRIRDVVNNREERLPEVGRYNAGQKLVFFAMVASLVGLLLTGLVMWRAYFSFPVGLIRFASFLHALCAFLLICTILLHIYAAIWVKGSMYAMLRGTVTPGWAWKHHRAWFRQITHAAHPRSGSD